MNATTTKATTKATNVAAETARRACDCCRGYERPGFILNAGAWMSCPKCNRQYVKPGEYNRTTHPVTSRIRGVETRGIPSPLAALPDVGPLTFIAVLVEGGGRDVACYVAVNASMEWTALHGRKVSLQEAEVYFPHLRSELERQGVTYRGPREG